MGTSGYNTISNNMLVSVFALVLVCLSSSTRAMEEISEKTWEKLHRYSLLCNCYGEASMAEFDVLQHNAMKKCGLKSSNVVVQTQAVYAAPTSTYAISSYNPYVSQGLYTSGGRRKRQTLQPTIEDKVDFLNDLAQFTGTLQSKMAALKCVLTEIGLLDAYGAINTAKLTYQAVATDMARTKAGQDPQFVKDISDNWLKCLDIANSFPASALDNPFKAEHGRHMIFFNCAKKVENNCCAKFLMNQHLETMYGPGATAKPGMPVNKFDAAALAVKVMAETASPEEMCVEDFLWGKPMSPM